MLSNELGCQHGVALSKPTEVGLRPMALQLRWQRSSSVLRRRRLFLYVMLSSMFRLGAQTRDLKRLLVYTEEDARQFLTKASLSHAVGWSEG